MNPVQLLAAVAPDVDAIAALHADNWLDAYRGILSDEYLDGEIPRERERLWHQRFSEPPPAQHVIVAKQGGALVGFVCLYGAHDPDHGTLIENLHVARSARGTGLGQGLLHAAARWSEDRHPGVGLHLWALERNLPARRFYERLGGTVTAEGSWSPPVGTPVPEVRYSWPDPRQLMRRPPRHLMRRPPGT